MCTGSHPFIPAANVARVALQFTLADQHVENVFNVLSGDTLTSALVDIIAETVADWYNTSLRPLQASTCWHTGVVARDISNEFGYETINVDFAGAHGGREEVAMPNEVTWKLKFGTATSGRNGRGGVFFIGLVRPDCDVNNVLPTVATNIRNAWGTLRTDLGPHNCDLAVVSYCLHHAWRTEALVSPVTSISYTDTVLDRQGRRGPGRGA